MGIKLTKSAAMWLLLLFLSTTGFAQFSVSGTVKDYLEEPLIGVSIQLKGTTSGTVTDLEGNFSLSVPDAIGTLIFSYTGFKSVEVEVTTDNNIVNLVLEDDVHKLDEVVVTGLGSGIKRSNSGHSVSTISAEELTGNTTTQTVDNAFFGKIPGVQISANGGSPGGGVGMQFRGVSTLGNGSSQPLYIIDGVYVDNSVIRTGRTNVNGASGGQAAANQDDAANRISDINPDDIEKVEVLKGPSAAAIYGTRANAGVVIITTKKGKAGKTRVSLRQDVGMAQGQNFQGFESWDQKKIELVHGTGDKGKAELAALNDAIRENRVTDWEEYLYGENGLLINTQLSISGGNEKTQFYVSGGMQKEDGIIKRTFFDRYSARINVDHRLSDRLKVSLNTNYTKTDNDRGYTGNQNNTGGSIGYNISYTPSYANLFPDATGRYPDNPYFNDNPIAVRDRGANNQKVDRFISAGEIDLDILRNDRGYLKFKLNGGLDYLSGNSFVYFPEDMQHQRAQANPGDVMWGRQDNLNYNIQGLLNFSQDFGELNSNTTVVATRLDQESTYLLSRGRGLSGGQTNLRWAKNVEARQQTNQRITDLGYTFQEDLNWGDKIILSAGVRFDRSTLNADQEKFYAFPKVSLAANLTNFDFWTTAAVSQLKIRAAYGQTGGLPNYGVTFATLTSTTIAGNVGSQISGREVDPTLKPETSQELEFGVDLGLFKNLITLEATIYNKKVNDLILDLRPASSTGITAIATNAADLENKGIELGLGVNPIRSTNFNWYSKILFWNNDSKITRLDIPAYNTGGFGAGLGTYLVAEGYSPTTIVGTPGGQEGIPLGFTIYGDRQPDWTATLSTTLNFLKSFDFNFLLHSQEGGNAINLSALLWDDGGTASDWSKDDDGDGTVNGQDRLFSSNGGTYVQPTSYLKLRELSLYYTLPNGLFGKFIEKAKIGVSANNLLLWTNYGSYDPEVSNFGIQAIAGNIEVTPYPSSRRLFFHVKLDF